MTMLTVARPRGCGERKKGGVYACCGLSPVGRPIEEYLLCPPRPVDYKFHRTPRLVDVIKGGPRKNALLIWIGEQYYPFVSDFIEEAREQGISRRLPSNLNVQKIELPAWMILVHAKARLMNAPSLGLTAVPKCPTGLHTERHLTEPCLWRSWQVATETPKGSRVREIGSTKYPVYPRPCRATPAGCRSKWSTVRRRTCERA
jgi:hypothetical protein